MFPDPDQFRFQKYQNLERHSSVDQFELASGHLIASRQRKPSRKSFDLVVMVVPKSRRQRTGVCDQTQMAHNRRRVELDRPRVSLTTCRTLLRRHAAVDRQDSLRTYSLQVPRNLETVVSPRTAALNCSWR